jgi:3-methyladenine DNA glycosylase AlkC
MIATMAGKTTTTATTADESPATGTPPVAETTVPMADETISGAPQTALGATDTPASAVENSGALKEIFNRERIAHIGAAMREIDPRFDGGRFLALATCDLAELSIMQRLRQVAVSLHECLDTPYPECLPQLQALAPRIGHAFASMILPEFVALYGQQHFDVSMAALAFFTRFGSSEFAVRHFLVRDLPRALAVMERWSFDPDAHVRRLASEGCRPRLPWSFQLKPLMQDPSLTAAILENLRSDESAYVRKSVANHLNDITKDHPAVVLQTLASWPKEDPACAWIIRHALRTLIKKGDATALALIGASGLAVVDIERFAVLPPVIALGEQIRIEAALRSTSPASQRLVIDYAVFYVRKSGVATRKVFKLKEVSLAPLALATVSIMQTIRDFSTRKHHLGLHRIELLVNGATLAEAAFELVAPRVAGEDAAAPASGAAGQSHDRRQDDAPPGDPANPS